MILDLDHKGGCCVVQREETRQCDETTALFCALCGCDCVPRVSGQGKVKARALLESCVTSKAARDAVLLNIEQRRVMKQRVAGRRASVTRGSLTRQLRSSDTPLCLNSTLPMMPTFWATLTQRSLSLRPPLNPLSSGTTNEAWAAMIGFDPFDLVKPGTPLSDFARCRVWSRTGESFRALDYPTQDGTKVPFGSTIDLARQPIETHPMQRLSLWLWARNVSPRSSSTWAEIIATVTSIVAMGDSGPAIQPAANAPVVVTTRHWKPWLHRRLSIGRMTRAYYSTKPAALRRLP